MTKIKIYAIIGKSGSGKDRLLKEIKKADIFHRFHYVVPTTTRPMRSNEKEGVDYYFKSSINEEDMFTLANYNNWFYGVEKNALSTTKPNLMVCNLISIEQLLHRPEVELLVIEVRAKDQTRLVRQLTRAKNADCAEILRRYYAEKIEYEQFFQHRSQYNIISFPNNNKRELRKIRKSCLHLGKTG